MITNHSTVRLSPAVSQSQVNPSSITNLKFFFSSLQRCTQTEFFVRCCLQTFFTHSSNQYLFCSTIFTFEGPAKQRSASYNFLLFVRLSQLYVSICYIGSAKHEGILSNRCSLTDGGPWIGHSVSFPLAHPRGVVTFIQHTLLVGELKKGKTVCWVRATAAEVSLLVLKEITMWPGA